MIRADDGLPRPSGRGWSPETEWQRVVSRDRVAEGGLPRPSYMKVDPITVTTMRQDLYHI
jgi:hypothetical protein